MNRKQGSISNENGKNLNKQGQTSKMKEEIGKIDTEDVTKYGEFVSSYFAWLSLEKQKENAKRIEDITDNK